MNNSNKIGSLYDGSYLATNTENFTDFDRVHVSVLPLMQSDIDTNSIENPDIALNYDIEGEDENIYPQYITYIDHPIIKNKLNMENEPSHNKNTFSSGDTLDVNIHFDKIVHFYFASLAVVGLFVLFRSIQKSKY